jgi:hypothetical protein
MKTPVLLALAAFLMNTVATQAADTRCYELRIYHAAPGKLDDLNARFRNDTMRIFEKHGIKNIGYWMPVENTGNRLIYVIEHPSREAANGAWKEFGADPEWQKVAKASEVNGRLVTKVDRYFMTATDYSPEIKPGKAGESRLFELRTYTCAPGKLDDLHARFRQHTCELFAKHGMTNFGYWTPLDQDKGAGNTLIYILAHKGKEASDASWKAFREDPDWVAVKKASEDKAGGSLTTKVESVFMIPTDYSPTK